MEFLSQKDLEQMESMKISNSNATTRSYFLPKKTEQPKSHLSEEEIEKMIKKQKDLLASPITNSLPDKGEKLRKRLEELEIMLKERRSSPSSMQYEDAQLKTEELHIEERKTNEASMDVEKVNNGKKESDLVEIERGITEISIDESKTSQSDKHAEGMEQMDVMFQQKTKLLSSQKGTCCSSYL